jgi:hypothetical protein
MYPAENKSARTDATISSWNIHNFISISKGICKLNISEHSVEAREYCEAIAHLHKHSTKVLTAAIDQKYRYQALARREFDLQYTLPEMWMVVPDQNQIYMVRWYSASHAYQPAIFSITVWWEIMVFYGYRVVKHNPTLSNTHGICTGLPLNYDTYRDSCAAFANWNEDWHDSHAMTTWKQKQRISFGHIFEYLEQWMFPFATCMWIVKVWLIRAHLHGP